MPSIQNLNIKMFENNNNQLILCIGDVSDFGMKSRAQTLSTECTLIDGKQAVDTFMNSKFGVFYTSLAFIQDLEIFLKVCRNADIIYYDPPVVWSDAKKDKSEQQKFVEIILHYVNQYIKVVGLSNQDTEYSFLSTDFVVDQRKTINKQMWAVGCSITKGDGVSIDQTWKNLLSKKMSLPYSDLSSSGSSILWQSDQICQADIQKDDIVFWGVTSHFRLPVIYEQNNSIFHLNNGSYEKSHHKEKTKHFPVELLVNRSLIYHNVMAIRRAVNFCNKVGAQIVMLGFMYDWDLIYTSYNVKPFRQSLSWPDQWLDVGDDNIHPGPKQHAKFAREFFDFYQELYC